MPHPFRALALVLASLLTATVAPVAEAAPKKTNRPATQSRQAAKPKPKPRPARPAPVRAAAVKPDKAQQLKHLYDEYWDASMRLNPLQATLQGDPRYNDQLPNYLSAAWRQQQHDFTTQWLGKVEAIGSDGLQGQDLLSYQIFIRDARAALDAERHPGWMLPISPYSNMGSIAAILGSGTGAQPFHTVKDYENWLKRSAQIPTLFDQAIANMREGIRAGVVQPRELVEQVLPQLDAVLRPAAEDSIFWMPIVTMPDTISEQDRTRLTAEYKRRIESQILPAYRALRGFLATEYMAAARPSTGMQALPDGQAWYASVVRQSTGTTMSAEQLHTWGERRTAELDDAITAVMKANKIRGSKDKLRRTMASDKRFQYTDAQALLTHYRQIQQQVTATLPTLFAPLPAGPLEVTAVPADRPMVAAAAYQPASPTNAGAQQAGHAASVQINTSNLPSRLRWSAPASYLHEGIPGHHLQLGVQQGLDALPRFRRLGGDTAFIEGWGLYAESLGDPLGLYQDPYARIGYLQAALTRAARVVADTGLHTQGWDKAKAVRYLEDVAALDEADASAEVDRMLAQPGQALSAVLGEATIIALRDRARAAQGDAFDLRRFHTEVIKDGSMPMDVFVARMEAWMASPAAPLPAAAAGVGAGAGAGAAPGDSSSAGTPGPSTPAVE